AGATTVSVCLPARDEEATVGDIVAAVVADLVERHPLVDEVLVVDDGSTDATAEVARRAGATVVAADQVLPEVGPGTGKGEALWKSLAASSGELVVWCDADLTDFDTGFVTGLLGPLLTDPTVAFTKATYERAEVDGVGGGRVTELAARPLIALVAPELSAFDQPLAGEYAGRRSVLERLPFEQGYGVELGLLLDLLATVGLEGMAQVDLGVRRHRNRPLHELSPQALAVMRAVLRRVGATGTVDDPVLRVPGHDHVVVDDRTRPPLVDVAGYRRRAS
ncbi:MAG TPA: glucosyl-3-phosphoglycerate synthase, partial [Acidimicrobiales bacterium]|nr:glucosyl-3-phosphoglycerate synthase [Acidimicrobiales bacterium]